MNYGFLIRNDRCIGCHACSTACKAENQVPLGVHRTWVKTVEAGAFPNVTRHFQVTRCNHCERPPCVTICPTRAMYRRPDGIVEFDPDRCIGCKACLQACPYDAIHIDPESGTAAKCHFCAHRVELGMEPPCVVVCPEHAIVAGDLDDPDSEIARMLGAFRVTVRRPEKGTRPKLFYVEGEEALLTPGLADAGGPGYAWTEGPELGPEGGEAVTHPAPIRIGGGRMAGGLLRTAYDVEHRIPWHWPVPAYLVTKGVSAGLFLLLAGGFLLGWIPFHAPTFLLAGGASLLFLALTTALLVGDLERPERFFWILLKPQRRSWLVKGAWILIAFGGVAGAWWGVEFSGWRGWLAGGEVLRPWLLGAGVPLAGLAAIYTAFLFGQAQGRDLWQSPLLPPRLLVQSLVAGSALLLVLGSFGSLPDELARVAVVTLTAGLLANLLVLLPAELGVGHGTEQARLAARAITKGRYRRAFWGGGVALGHLLPLALLAVGSASLAGALALAGAWMYEHAFIMAPQQLRNS